MKINTLLIPAVLGLMVLMATPTFGATETDQLSDMFIRSESDTIEERLADYKVAKAISDQEAAQIASDAIYFLGYDEEDNYKNWQIKYSQTAQADNALQYEQQNADAFLADLTIAVYEDLLTYDLMLKEQVLVDAQTDYQSATLATMSIKNDAGLIDNEALLLSTYNLNVSLYEAEKLAMEIATLKTDLIGNLGDHIPEALALIGSELNLPTQEAIDLWSNDFASTDATLQFLKVEIDIAQKEFNYAKTLFADNNSTFMASAIALSTAELNYQNVINKSLLDVRSLMNTNQFTESSIAIAGKKVSAYEAILDNATLAYSVNDITALELKGLTLELLEATYAYNQAVYTKDITLFKLQSSMGYFNTSP